MTNRLQPELRRARLDDADQIGALFRLVYESSSHPCKNTPFVADTLQDTETHFWFVSEDNGRLSACVGLLRHRWNRSWELVRGLTHPDYRGGFGRRNQPGYVVAGGPHRLALARANEWLGRRSHD